MQSKVSLKRCGSYRQPEVYAAISEAIGLLGGMELFVKPGDRVLIKPNLLSARPPERAITTHPEVLRSVIRLVKEAGGRPMVGDSHGGSHYKMEDVYEKTGTGRVCEEEGAEKLVFEKFKKINGIPIALAALEADVLISIPKFKTHALTIMTAGIKNVFGAVPGLNKTQCHMQAPSPSAFAKLLADVYSYVTPGLSILDGITAMEGEGPGSSGTPRQMDLVACSADAVSLDSVLCRIIGVDPSSVAVIKEAGKRSLGESDPGKIQILGDDWRSFHKKDFKLPRTTLLHRLPNYALKPLAFMLGTEPDIKHDSCRKCGICAKSCPAEAISEIGGRLVFDRKKCILCLCCMEFCPHNAVYIRKNLLFRLLGS